MTWAIKKKSERVKTFVNAFRKFRTRWQIFEHVNTFLSRFKHFRTRSSNVRIQFVVCFRSRRGASPKVPRGAPVRRRAGCRGPRLPPSPQFAMQVTLSGMLTCPICSPRRRRASCTRRFLRCIYIYISGNVEGGDGCKGCNSAMLLFTMYYD